MLQYLKKQCPVTLGHCVTDAKLKSKFANIAVRTTLNHRGIQSNVLNKNLKFSFVYLQVFLVGLFGFTCSKQKGVFESLKQIGKLYDLIGSNLR